MRELTEFNLLSVYESRYLELGYLEHSAISNSSLSRTVFRLPSEFEIALLEAFSTGTQVLKQLARIVDLAYMYLQTI